MNQPCGITVASGPTQAMFSADLASRSLGIQLLAAHAGTASVTMTVTPRMGNGYGLAHGGYLFLLADTACACNSHGPVTVAAGAHITFVAPARRATCSWQRRTSAPDSAAAASMTSASCAAMR